MLLRNGAGLYPCLDAFMALYAGAVLASGVISSMCAEAIHERWRPVRSVMVALTGADSPDHYGRCSTGGSNAVGATAVANHPARSIN